MYASKFFLTFVSRELFKYWRVNAGKWVSFNAHNSSALETQGGKSTKYQKQEKNTYSEMLFILSICEREKEN